MPEVKISLRILRAELNLSQKEFAKLIGMPFSTYQKKETGTSPITLNEAYKISQVANRTVEQIFFTI